MCPICVFLCVCVLSLPLFVIIIGCHSGAHWQVWPDINLLPVLPHSLQLPQLETDRSIEGLAHSATVLFPLYCALAYGYERKH